MCCLPPGPLLPGEGRTWKALPCRDGRAAAAAGSTGWEYQLLSRGSWAGILAPTGLSTECCHLGLKKTGYSVKAWRLVGREVRSWGCSPALALQHLSCSHFPEIPNSQRTGPVWLVPALSHLHRKQARPKTGHRVLGAGSVGVGGPHGR